MSQTGLGWGMLADLAFETNRTLGYATRCRCFLAQRCGAQNNSTVDRWRDPIEEPTWWYDLHAAARELLDADTGIALLCSA
jgi:hypothetical protein